MLDKLIHSIRSDTPVLTVNVRLTQHIRSEYDRAMKESGKTVWRTPLIMPFSAWLENLRNESWPDEPLISKVRSTALWETIISADETLQGRGILMAQGMAKTAFDAYRLMREYRIKLPEDDIYFTEEAGALKRWAALYEERLRELGFMERSHLPETIIKLVREGKVELPDEIILAGFDEITPQVREVTDSLEAKGCEVTFWPHRPPARGEIVELPDVRGRVRIREYDDEISEVIQAARWVRKIYRTGMRVGIVVPDLGRYRNIIKREFAAELDPRSLLPWENPTGIFNISLGSTLYDEPIVRSALDILSVDGGRQETGRISRVILSPYLVQSMEEKLQLARLDAELKRKNRMSVSLADIRVMLGGDRYNVPLFSSVLDIWIRSIREGGKPKLPGEWVDDFNRLFKDIGWPSGEVSISSSEYQALGAWGEALSSLAGLDEITGRIKRSEAVNLLARIAMEKIHQPETAESPIEIMGLLESSGIGFDHLWIMGAHDDALPGDPSPNPFIPLSLQKKHNLPRSSPERELRFARQLLRRVLTSAKTFEVSWPKKVGDKEVKLSPLIAGMGEAEEKIIIADSCRYRDALHNAGWLEDMPEERPIPVTASELETIHGGTAILKNQSDCPFRAFALHRLASEDIETPEPGITAMERGSIVHRAMEHFWDVVKGSERLKELIDSGGLGEIIREAAEKGVRSAQQVRPIEGSFIEIELDRLEALIDEWIEVEAKRGRFLAMGREAEEEIQAGGLKLKGRIDRVDELEGGGGAIIDYKTGSTDPNDWLTDRPKEPQLMLYSMTGDYDAITFARLKRGECRFAGIARDEDLLPGVKPYGRDSYSRKMEGVEGWEELMERWKGTVTGLADSFMNGEAEVDPRDYGTEDSACRYCGQAVLCRVFEKED